MQEIACIAARADTLKRLRSAKAHPRIAEKAPIRLYFPNYALLTCGF